MENEIQMMLAENGEWRMKVSTVRGENDEWRMKPKFQYFQMRMENGE